MSTNILSLKLHRQYVRCINSLTTKESEIRHRGISFVDDFLLYIHQCHSSISDKVTKGITSKKSKNKYEKTFDEFNFYLLINEDLSCVVGVDFTKSISKKINSELLKSAYLVNGYVYFLKSEYGFKIGCTKDITRRFKELKTLMPFKLSLHSFIKTDDYRSLESIFHSSLTDKRINGEWFNLDLKDFEYIDELCKIHKCIRISK